MTSAQELRQEFPFFRAHPDLAYLDNAATTQKPYAVVEAISRHLCETTANTGRSSHHLAGRLTASIERTRAEVALFLGADADGLAFTSGATAGLNAVVANWAAYELSPGDQVLVSPSDHAATVGPWQALAATHQVELVPYAVTPSGDADLADVRSKVTDRTRVLALTHVHHVFGERTDIAEFRAALPERGVISVDAAQSMGHTVVDAAAMGADFVAFSGHKMFGPTGTGVLWVAPRVRHQLRPTLAGGRHDQAPSVAAALEFGTLNTVGILGLGAAVQFLVQVGVSTVERRLSQLTGQLVDGLRELPRLQLLPGVAASSCGRGYGIVSFRIDGLDAADVGFILDSEGICVRTGSHCAHGDALTGNSVRISAHAYNTDAEIERLVGLLGRIVRA